METIPIDEPSTATTAPTEARCVAALMGGTFALLVTFNIGPLAWFAVLAGGFVGDLAVRGIHQFDRQLLSLRTSSVALGSLLLSFGAFVVTMVVGTEVQDGWMDGLTVTGLGLIVCAAFTALMAMLQGDRLAAMVGVLTLAPPMWYGWAILWDGFLRR